MCCFSSLQHLAHALVHRFISIDNLYTPVSTGHDDNIFITKSYDATTHFETVAEDVADVYERVTVS
jgi:Rab GDP dissociation inhibitor